MWQDKKYQFITLFIYLYEDHLIWDEVGFAGRQFTLYYTDIISVSGGNAGKHLGGTSRFEINTAGQTYKYSSTLGAFAGLEECTQIINERIQHFRNNGSRSANSAGFANNININPDNIEPTITRIDIFLEDGEWGKVKSYANAALDYFPTDYRLYKYLLLADMQCKSISALKNSTTSFASNSNYKKLDRYADESLKKELKDILEYIEKEPLYKQARSTSDKKKALELFKGIRGYKDSNDYISSLQARIKEDEEREKEKDERNKESKYQAAIQLQDRAETIEDYKKALEAFEELKTITNDSNTKRHYDVVKRHKEVQKKYDELKTENDYEKAVELLASGDASKAKNAKATFDKLQDYKDSINKSAEAQSIIDAAKAKTKKKIIIIGIIAAICLAGIIVVSNIAHQKNQEKAYNNAIALYEAGDFEQAKGIFDQLSDYEDSAAWSEKCTAEIEAEQKKASKYADAVQWFNWGYFEDAAEAFEKLGDYKDSPEQLKKAQEVLSVYNTLEKLDDEGDFAGLREAIDKIRDYMPKDELERYDKHISKYSPWVGTYKFKKGDANAVTLHGAGVNELTAKIINQELVLEYDGESQTLERELDNTVEHGYDGIYFVHNFDDYTLCVYRDSEDGSLWIECDDHSGDEFMEYNGYYSKE